MTPELLFEDNHLYVVNKPAGMLTQSDATQRPALEDICKEELRKKTGKETIFLQPIHRLDRLASGIVVFARSSKALSRLQKAMREGEISKTYWACVEGKILPEQGEWENWLVHDSFKARVVEEGDPEGKRSLLRYRTLRTWDGMTLLEINLLTGRYHQIRVQASHRGHPILGDKKYGSRKTWSEGIIALHHQTVSFLHPVKKETVTFSCPPSAAWDV